MTDDLASTNEEADSGFTERVFGRIVGSVVSPVVGNIDLDEVVEQVDVNRLIERVDIDELVDRVDVERVIERVDLNAVLDDVDLNAVLDRVDANALLDRVEPDRLLDRVDPDRLLDRVDPNALLDRVDADRLMERVDVNALVERTEISNVISRSTAGVFTSLLDVARTQLITVDQFVQAAPARLLRGARREAPGRPADPSDVPDLAPMRQSQRAIALQGHWAGSVSRFLAFVIDYFLIGLLYSAGLLLTSLAVQVVLGTELQPEEYPLLSVLAFALWVFTYVAGSLAATGRTIGKSVLGLLVVGADGSALRGRRAALRTIVFPVSFLIFGVGCLMGLVRRDRRQLHDLAAETAVVYAWDARTAQLREDAEAESELGGGSSSRDL